MKYQIVNMEKMNKIRLLQVAKLDEYREEIKTLCNSVIESDGIITRLKKELNSKQDHLPQFLGSLSRDKVRLYSTCENYGGHSEYYLTIFPDLKYFIVVGREYSQERIDQVLKAVSEFGCHDWLAQQDKYNGITLTRRFDYSGIINYREHMIKAEEKIKALIQMIIDAEKLQGIVKREAKDESK